MLVDAREIAEVGIVEVIKHIPTIYRRFRQVVREAERRRPDAAVLIDFPDFNLRLARELHQRGVPVIYYVSPQLWAWKQRRIERVRKYVRQMLVIFPFEEKFYRERGIAAKFVGHPLADLPAPSVTRESLPANTSLIRHASGSRCCPAAGTARCRASSRCCCKPRNFSVRSTFTQCRSLPRSHADWVASFLRGLFGTADYLHARCARDAAACAGGGRGQRHLDAGSLADRHTFRHGLSGCAAHLERWAAV